MASGSFKASVATLMVILAVHCMTMATVVNSRVVSTEFDGSGGSPSSSPYSSPSSYYGEYGYSAPPPYEGGGYSGYGAPPPYEGGGYSGYGAPPPYEGGGYSGYGAPQPSFYGASSPAGPPA